MADINRRQALVMGIGAAVAAALPVTTAAAAPALEAAKPDILAWAVGTPGEFDWDLVNARTYEEAKRLFVCDKVGGDGCEEGGEADCECEWCFEIGSVEAERQEIWDGLTHVNGADFIRAGMGAYCARCSYEAFASDCAQVVNEVVICHDCMTLADWDIVDPEHAAELRDEAAALLGDQQT